jgi:hypothetical protein
MSEEKRPAVYPLGTVAQLCGKSERWVQLLVQQGYITQEKKGEYILVNVVRGVVAYYEALLEKSNKAAAASRATDARTRQIEQQMEIRLRNLVPRSEFYQAQDFVVGKIRASLAGLPARVTRNLEDRAKIEAEIDDALRRTAENIERAAHALEEGGVVLEALAEGAPGSVGGEE